jgi:hypothetical protein
VFAAALDELLLPMGFVRLKSTSPLCRDLGRRVDGVFWTVGTQRNKHNTRHRCSFTVNFGVGIDGYGPLVGHDAADPLSDLAISGRLGSLAVDKDVWWTIARPPRFAWNRARAAARRDRAVVDEIRTSLAEHLMPRIGAVRHAGDLAQLLESADDPLIRACATTPFLRAKAAAVVWHLAGDASRCDAMLAEAERLAAGGPAGTRDHLAAVRKALGR